MPDDLDAQVARKLGWKFIPKGTYPGVPDEWLNERGGHTSLECWSTDIRAAMELVEGLHVVLYNSRCGADGWTCIIYPQNEVEHVRATMVVADTPALAIVQAFLQLPEKGAVE